MPLFRVVVVVGGAVALAEEAVVEVVIAGLAGAEVRFDIRAAEAIQAADGIAAEAIRAADGIAAQALQAADGPGAEATEGQTMVVGVQITVRYVTIPRLERLGLEVRAQLVVKSSPAPEEAKLLLGEDRGEAPGELFAVPQEGRQDALAVREEGVLEVFEVLAVTELRAYVGLAVVGW